MQSSDFEIVVGAVQAKPGMTGRELASYLRRQGHKRFDSKLANQILYRLHAASLVERDASGDKPKWNPSGSWSPGAPSYSRPTPTKRPLSVSDQETKKYLIGPTEVKVLLDNTASLNDFYISTDWVGSHVVSSVNVNHPFWDLRLSSPQEESLFCMIAAIDAYVQWKVAQMHEPPDAREVQRMRDQAFRLCSLVESEQVTSD